MDDLTVDDGNSHAVAKDTDDDIGDVDCSVDEGNGGDTGGGGGGGGGWTRSHWLSGMHASVSQYSITTDEFLGTGIGLIPPPDLDASALLLSYRQGLAPTEE